ncbi:hypothetical protein BJ875DRAFT_506520 [Amylocarpus encephaloides]|uniref:Uncharacterized protein n=1 Tax=Amylocarpus encephaloides TaxID=45428 RepID=A0A9P7YEF1_9HELO|nr:hypothetical protein BJ875DRAFT_506520 [Amylocarpus encephaloides]
MRLLQYNSNGDSLTEFFDSDIPKYTILSHRWGAEEVTLKDLIDGTSKSKADYGKIQFCGEQAKQLIAPASVDFFSKEGELLGNKASLERHIYEITGIPVSALRGSLLSDFSIAERMSWAERRETTRKEDQAYSLLGIFDVYMPLIYGEGKEHAFKRLRELINAHSRGK